MLFTDGKSYSNQLFYCYIGKLVVLVVLWYCD